MTNTPLDATPSVVAVVANKRPGFVLSEPHRAGCWGAEAGGFVVSDGSEKRDKNGRKHKNGVEWLRFRCNDPSCNAVALVRWDVLADFVNAGTGGDFQKDDGHVIE